jgi:heme exporter protein CcmB
MNHLALLVGKDLRLEWRSRDIIISMGLIALLLVVVLAATRAEAALAPAAMWVTYAFGATLGFTRAFTIERDQLTALLLAPVDRSLIYVAKSTANWLALTVVQAVSLPLFGALFTESIWRHLPALVLPLLLGGLALAVIGTLFGALITQTRLREVLLPILMLPVAVPVLVAAAGATAGILDGQPLSAVAVQLQLLGAFDMLFATTGVLLFDVLIGE